MFVGHYAIALAAKRVAPEISLGKTFLAVQFLDVLWGVTILLGFEHARIVPGLLPGNSIDFYDYPWTHGLLMAFAWSWLVFRFSKSLVLGGCVLSHWLLDFIVHRPDLPIYRGGSLVGLGLWRFREATFAVETILVLLGLAVYLKTTQPKSPAGRYAMSVFVGALILLDAFNLYGPAPKDMTSVAISAEVVFFLLAGIAWKLDQFREPVDRSEPPLSIMAGVE
jgi:hypothetical protein